MKSTKLIPMFGLVIGLCAAFASHANAQCGVSVVQRQGGQVAFATMRQAPDEREMGHAAIQPQGNPPTLVGLWDLQFISDGQLVDEGFDQYHDDGTEILNDTPPPATGNVCLGVYAQTGKRTFHLKHPSWIYDQTNTTVIGRATILEDITVDPSGNTFSGSFTIQLRDLTGNPLGPDLTGQLKADRIVPQ
jgi:hypothetical protein